MLAPPVVSGGAIHVVMSAMGADPSIALFLSVVVGLLTLVLAFLLVRPSVLRIRRKKE
ncbi:hypothetical protein [Futiania mangrovi]|uniref:Uncharacterized protein n=1 Tax=Futiania mangrovi TaxID=2959716 RepID=A0A9J6PNS6_9PROT|nr:hypothetical protein [Futiania mangrovii]MCP1337738.1 hypothetical protein [Futiania mangrovii]